MATARVATLSGGDLVEHAAADSLDCGAGLVGAIGKIALAGDWGGSIYSAGNISGSTTLDAAYGCIQLATMTGAVTLQVPSNLVAGHHYTILLQQDATGGRVLTLASGWTMLGSTPAWDLTPSAYSVLHAIAVTTSLLLVTSVGGAIQSGYTGTGVSGVVTASSTTLAAGVYCDQYLVPAGVTVDAYQYGIFARQLIKVDATGKIHADGYAGGSGAAGGAAGACRGERNLSTQGCAGGAGQTGAGSAGTSSALNAYAGTAGTGGAGSSGGGGAGGVTSLSAVVIPQALPRAIIGAPYGATNGGAGGGGGGGNGSVKGGGGGGGGSALLLVTPCLINNGTISSAGGNGGAGDPAGNTGGGGGGVGGVVQVISRWISGTAPSVAAGTGGGGTGTGTSGGNGAAGIYQWLPLT